VKQQEQELLRLDFNSCSSNLQDIRARVRSAANAAGCSAQLVEKLVLVVDEAIANVIRHGYKGSECGDIRLCLSRQGNHLHIELTDWAEPVDPGCIKPRDLSECRPGGLGINFIDSVMDFWEFRRPRQGPGNLLVMDKIIDKEGGANE